MSYPAHPITDRLQRDDGVSARAVGHADQGRHERSHGAEASSQTSAQSWAETDLKGLLATQKAAAGVTRATSRARSRSCRPCRPRRRRAGGATPDAPKPETRVVVIGRLGLRRQRPARLPGQPRPLHEHASNWLAQQENLIAIRPTDPQDRRIQLTQDQSDGDLLSDGLHHPRAVPGDRHRRPGGSAGRSDNRSCVAASLSSSSGRRARPRRVRVLRRIEEADPDAAREARQGLHGREREDRRGHGQVGDRRSDEAEARERRVADRFPLRADADQAEVSAMTTALAGVEMDKTVEESRPRSPTTRSIRRASASAFTLKAARRTRSISA